MLIHDRATPLARRRTPEGFLEMRARIGRAGLHDYRAGEVGGPPGVAPDTPVRVYRPPEEVFAPASMASFAGKPVTLDHPAAMVDSGNWRDHAVGHSGQGVVRDGDHVAADLFIADADAVVRAEAGAELSNGYWADFDFTPGVTPEGEPYDAVQRNIRGNHVALVDQGRCGASCAVPPGTGDAAASAAVVDCSPADAALVVRLRADLQARDGEIAALRARAAADARNLDRRAAERAAVLDAARRILGPGFEAAGLDLDEIRRAALVAALGADAVRGRGDGYVAAAFDTLAALPGARADRVAAHVAAGDDRPFAALQARNAALAGAWKSEGDR
ncbi:DUF2213 domain-containing protein [Lichenibacterium minor]|uniref:DUF2213 domain-containing protein n=1 Tax=Lichenibacterium minor TaxID=2316528 RepID=A0A4Q2U0V8_9HYPH|nr:DUF2213 domain-containing protein [Lichenibacterium minor]RYC29288.1 DUF2213 domain-containing protein [Lichenibacterium minor]